MVEDRDLLDFGVLENHKTPKRHQSFCIKHYKNRPKLAKILFNRHCIYGLTLGVRSFERIQWLYNFNIGIWLFRWNIYFRFILIKKPLHLWSGFSFFMR